MSVTSVCLHACVFLCLSLTHSRTLLFLLVSFTTFLLICTYLLVCFHYLFFCLSIGLQYISENLYFLAILYFVKLSYLCLYNFLFLFVYICSVHHVGYMYVYFCTLVCLFFVGSSCMFTYPTLGISLLFNQNIRF